MWHDTTGMKGAQSLTSPEWINSGLAMDQSQISHALTLHWPFINLWIIHGSPVGWVGSMTSGHGLMLRWISNGPWIIIFLNHVSNQMLNTSNSDKLNQTLVLSNKYNNESIQETDLGTSLIAASYKECLCGLQF